MVAGPMGFEPPDFQLMVCWGSGAEKRENAKGSLTNSGQGSIVKPEPEPTQPTNLSFYLKYKRHIQPGLLKPLENSFGEKENAR